MRYTSAQHDDVIKSKHFLHYQSRWILRTKASDVEVWCFFDLCLNKQLCLCEAGDLRRYRVTVISSMCSDMTDMSKPCKDQQKNAMALYEVRAREEYQNFWCRWRTFRVADTVFRVAEQEHIEARQNGRHFADNIFKCIFVNENVSIAIKMSLTFLPKGSIKNIPALVPIMAWRRPGDKPLSEPMMVSLPTHICVTQPQWVKQSMALFSCYYFLPNLYATGSYFFLSNFIFWYCFTTNISIWNWFDTTDLISTVDTDGLVQ